MNYRNDSLWNDKNELRCLLIFKKLQAEGFPRGKQIEYCRELSKNTKLDSGSLSAKVCNYKSVAGVNNASNASIKTKELYKNFGHLSVHDLEKKIESKLTIAV